MLVKCPSCGGVIRVAELQPTEKLAPYFCPECEQIVKLDVITDEVPTSSSPDTGRYRVAERRQRILVVDDTPAFLALMEKLLHREGYIVLTAQNGVEALKKITEDRPDAVILDLFMPKMTG